MSTAAITTTTSNSSRVTGTAIGIGSKPGDVVVVLPNSCVVVEDEQERHSTPAEVVVMVSGVIGVVMMVSGGHVLPLS